MRKFFKQQISLIAYNVSILKFNTWIDGGRGWIERAKNTLINDVWCGFTNYIFQAFKSETRLIAEEKLSECELSTGRGVVGAGGEEVEERKSAELVRFRLFVRFLITIAPTHKLRELNESFLTRECLLKIFHPSRRKINFFSLFPPPFSASSSFPLSSTSYSGESREIESGESLRFPTRKSCCGGNSVNLLFKWVEIYFKFCCWHLSNAQRFDFETSTGLLVGAETWFFGGVRTLRKSEFDTWGWGWKLRRVFFCVADLERVVGGVD